MTEPVPGASAILDPAPPPELTREQATARLEQVKQDPEWLTAFARGEKGQLDEHAKLIGSITKLDLENMAATETARAALERQQVVDHLRKTADIPDGVARMVVENSSVTAAERQLAEQERSRLMADQAWVKEWLSGSRAARTRLALVDVILARPVLST
jgi:hypothetical protein